MKMQNKPYFNNKLSNETARKKRRLERPRDTVSNSIGRHVTYHRGPVTMSATLQMSSKIWLRGVSG